MNIRPTPIEKHNFYQPLYANSKLSLCQEKCSKDFQKQYIPDQDSCVRLVKRELSPRSLRVCASVGLFHQGFFYSFLSSLSNYYEQSRGMSGQELARRASRWEGEKCVFSRP